MAMASESSFDTPSRPETDWGGEGKAAPETTLCKVDLPSSGKCTEFENEMSKCFIVLYSFSQFLENAYLYYAPTHCITPPRKQKHTTSYVVQVVGGAAIFFLLRRHSAEAKPVLKVPTFPARHNTYAY